MQEIARPWEPRFVPRETVPETVRCLLRRRPLRGDHVGQQQHFLPVLSSGAQPDAMSGGLQDVVTIQSADEEGGEHAGG